MRARRLIAAVPPHPVLHPTAPLGARSRKEIRMTTTPRRRLLTLVTISACVLLAVMGAAALGAGHLGHTERPDAASRAFAVPDDTTLPRLAVDRASWSGGGTSDVITVAGTKCPKSHPRKIGSSTSQSWTQVDGKLTHRARHRVICAR